MGRTSSVRYWQRKGGGYFTTRRGHQIELAIGPDDAPHGPTYKAAMRVFAVLVEQDAPPDAYTVRAACNTYRAYLDRSIDKSRVVNFDSAMKGILVLHGNLAVRELLPHHVSSWLDSQTWSEGYRRHAQSMFVAAINRCVREGHAPTNPLRGRLARLEASTRGSESRMSTAVCDAILASTSGAMRLLLRVLRETGCRPIEARRAKVKNLRGHILVLPWNPPRGDYKHKTARTKRDRIICLPSALADDVRSKRGPEEPLLVTPRGQAWRAKNLTSHWARIPAGEKYTPYCFRHTFISDWIDSGRSVKVCAALCGTSVAMIEQVYGHHDDGALYEMFLAFTNDRK